MKSRHPLLERGHLSHCQVPRACAEGFNQRSGQLVNRALEIGVVRAEPECLSIVGDGFGDRTAPPLEIGESADRQDIFRSGRQDAFELALGFVEPVELHERSPERDLGGRKAGMDGEAGLTGADGGVEPPGAAVLFGELSERNRRGVRLDPAPQVFNP
jgi:hypothetical protein